MTKSTGNGRKADVVEFAEDLGRLLGMARGKADKWLAQRQAVVKDLTEIRDTATNLLRELGHIAEKELNTPAARTAGRRMSEKARALISAAQKARWARVKKAVAEGNK